MSRRMERRRKLCKGTKYDAHQYYHVDKQPDKNGNYRKVSAQDKYKVTVRAKARAIRGV